MISYWKPVAVLVLIAFIYSLGFREAERKCNSANLKAEITELKRQSDAAKKVLKSATRDSATRVLQIEEMTKKVEAYEIDISEKSQCALSTDDARKLRDIR